MPTGMLTRCAASSQVRPEVAGRKPAARAMATAAANTFQPRSTGVSGCSRWNAASRWPADADARRVLVGHRPADAASPRAASRSRSRAASAGTRPGMRASVAAAAVCSCTVASPNRRSSGPGGHVDVLHPAVRHDDQLAEEDAAGDQQVVGPLGVAPRRAPRRPTTTPAPRDARPGRRRRRRRRARRATSPSSTPRR